MSYSAMVKGSQKLRSAFELRDEYANKGIIYKNLFCPFCGIELVAKAIYGKNFKKSPHFSSGVIPHRWNCTGDITVENIRSSSLKTKSFIKNVYGIRLEVPEKLVVDNGIKIELPCIENIENFTEKLVNDRIRTAGVTHEKVPIYTTKYIRDFVKAKQCVLSKIYKSGDTNNAEKTKTILKSLPLTLLDYKTNYYEGIRKSTYYSKSLAIWQGKGTVIFQEGIYFINAEEILNGEISYLLEINILCSQETLGTYNYSNILQSAYINKKELKWHILGKIELDMEKLKARLYVDNPKYMYFE